jgi:hypothetical protein
MQTPGSFQITTELEKKQPIEKPGTAPGTGNPPMESASIRAMKTNTGVIYLGDSTVTAATGFELAAGDSLNIDVTSLGNLYMFASKAGDKLCVFWVGP